MKTIPLTRGLFAQVDDADYGFLNQWKWSTQSGAAKKLYAVRGESHGGKQTTILMHRVILHALPHVEVDHRDNDGLNNQRHNIRICSHSQNICNRKINYNSSTGFKGVTFRPKRRGRWEARIQVNKQPVSLGFFNSAKQAAVAYNDAATKLHGEFARLNPV